jgi:hypothetical protein
LYTLNSGNLVGTFNITLSPSIKSQTVAIASGRAYNKGIRSIKMDATPTGEANDLSIEFVADSNITTSTIDEDKGTGVNVTGLGMVVSATLSNYTDNKLSLTLTYTDDILSAVGVTDATSLKFFHYTGGQWESVTTTVNTSNKTITGEFTSLSPVDIGAEVRIGRFVQRTNNPVIIKGSGGITVRNTYG